MRGFRESGTLREVTNSWFYMVTLEMVKTNNWVVVSEVWTLQVNKVISVIEWCWVLKLRWSSWTEKIVKKPFRRVGGLEYLSLFVGDSSFVSKGFSSCTFKVVKALQTGFLSSCPALILGILGLKCNYHLKNSIKTVNFCMLFSVYSLFVFLKLY